MPQERAQRATERDALLVLTENPAPLGTAPEVLPDEVQHPPILDVHRQLVQVQEVIDRGVIRFYVGSEEKAVLGKVVPDLPHRRRNLLYPSSQSAGLGNYSAAHCF